MSLSRRFLAQPKGGFSLVEMLLVISVMALLATLTIGGVLRSMKHTRERRISAMCSTLQTALVGFKAQEGRWPSNEMRPGTINGSQQIPSGDEYDRELNRNRVIFTGENNWQIFRELIVQGGNNKSYYLSTSEFFTKTSMPARGKRRGGVQVISLREALDEGSPPFPLGYPDPNDQSKFRYFRVEFNLLTDSVSVSKE